MNTQVGKILVYFTSCKQVAMASGFQQTEGNLKIDRGGAFA